ncbi:hypothetical protein CAEBREN_02844 [Caenorhabditis brenneri]|uniref:SPK domain-containing protein n=1 Tax=Caenorhabditis brenneri TaxID=135651 RepID=G0MFW6_CAEBE|nr:hypothetical protein CAEBREN_02844 [Caenorhabditis brenneri]
MPFNSKHWITDPEYIDLLNYIIDQTKNVESPMSLQRLVREFKEKSGAAQTVKCLKTRLREDGLVEVDEKNRIVYYKANDGSLELRGDHSRTAKIKTSKLESKQSLRSLIINYFENKNNADAVPKNEEERETGNLIEFITEKCDNVNSPLSIGQLTEDFNNRLGTARSFYCIHNRVKGYCREIQTLEFLDTHSKVKQLFCLSATLDSDCLEKLREDALVDVDEKNRITMYTANDNSLTLRGRHWGLGNTNPRRIRKKTVKGVVNKSDNEELDDGSDEYSSEELDSEFDTDDEAGNREMSIEDDFEYDPPSPTTPKSFKRKTDTTGSSSSKRIRPSSNNSMRPNELDDYDTNYSIDDQVKLKPAFGSTQENLNEIEGDEDFQQVLKSPQALDEHDQVEEVTIKIEIDDPKEIKPEIAHNPKIKFFEAMHSLIVCLDTPSLAWIQSKIKEVPSACRLQPQKGRCLHFRNPAAEETQRKLLRPLKRRSN